MNKNTEICILKVPVDLSANWEFYMAFNMFKIAAICQGIWVELEMAQLQQTCRRKRNTVYPLSEAAWATIEQNF